MEQITSTPPSPTIAAISTPHGSGAIAIVRMSGPDSIDIASKVWQGKELRHITPRHATLGHITDSDGEILDQVLLTTFQAPASFTGENMVEIACHGSRYLQRAILSRLIDAGAKPAGPGEFSMRAVMNGQMDLAQAEGVADLIASSSRASASIAMRQMKGKISTRLNTLTDKLTELASLIELELDFSEEEVEFASRSRLLSITDTIASYLQNLIDSYSTGSAIKDGIPITIAGAPNAGKSSLLNAITNDERAIVSDIPGTTRDTIEETVTLGPYLFRLTDTAGLRHTADPIEKAGIERTRKAIETAGILLAIIDATLPPDTTLIPTPYRADTHTLILLNKCDLPTAQPAEWRKKINKSCRTADIIDISTQNANDIEKLKEKLVLKAQDMEHHAGEEIITSERHRTALTEAHTSIQRVKDALEQSLPMDMLTQDIRHAIHHLGTVTGHTITTPTLLNHLFSHFCIGK